MSGTAFCTEIVHRGLEVTVRKALGDVAGVLEEQSRPPFGRVTGITLDFARSRSSVDIFRAWKML